MDLEWIKKRENIICKNFIKKLDLKLHILILYQE